MLLLLATVILAGEGVPEGVAAPVLVRRVSTGRTELFQPLRHAAVPDHPRACMHRATLNDATMQ